MVLYHYTWWEPPWLTDNLRGLLFVRPNPAQAWNILVSRNMVLDPYLVFFSVYIKGRTCFYILLYVIVHILVVILHCVLSFESKKPLVQIMIKLGKSRSWWNFYWPRIRVVREVQWSFGKKSREISFQLGHIGVVTTYQSTSLPDWLLSLSVTQPGFSCIGQFKPTLCWDNDRAEVENIDRTRSRRGSAMLKSQPWTIPEWPRVKSRQSLRLELWF